MRCGDFRTTYPADMAIFDSSVSRVLLAAFLAVLLVVPIFATSYWMDVANRIGIAVIAALYGEVNHIAIDTTIRFQDGKTARIQADLAVRELRAG